MLGIAKAAAVVGALVGPPVAYVAYSASQNGDNGNHLVYSLPVAFSG